MSGWTIRKKNGITLEHLSTMSLIKMTVISEEEVEQGKMETVEQIAWFDYVDFDDLVELIKETDFN